MVKKLSAESENAILIIMIITFIACLSLLLFFISYLDKIYNITEQSKTNQGELGSYRTFIMVYLAITILLLVISGTYIIKRIKNKYFTAH